MPPKKQRKNDKPVLSSTQEEEMSSALIARLLAQDAMQGGGSDYYAEYSNDSHQYEQYQGGTDNNDDSYEDESDDYAPQRSKKSKKPKAKKTEAKQQDRKRKKSPVDTTVVNLHTASESTESTQPTVENMENAESSNSNTNIVKAKKAKKPLPPGFNTGTYKAKEKELFLEGLHLYGRNWSELSRHMGTRDSDSIRSHAQKYFIRLFRDKLPLPDKVRESGEGYTLSGKPLDPNSAAAKSYFGKNGKTTDHTEATDKPPLDIDEPMQLDQQPGCASEDTTITESASLQQQSPNLHLNDQTSTPSEKPTPKKSPKPKSTKKKSERIDQKAISNETTYNNNGRTNYASSRPQRTKNSKPINYQHLTNSSDPLTMVKCQPFDGKPGSDSPGAQPFGMTVHSNALLAMDFHAHLMQTEIIGFLAGEWNKTTKHITVKHAYPCRSVNTGRNEVNVEMEPTSSIETRQLIEDKNMVVVGWYHSHPTFVPDPSLVDIENQYNYQKHCKDDCHTPNPSPTPPSSNGHQTPTETTPSASSSESTSTTASSPKTIENPEKTHSTTISNEKSVEQIPSTSVSIEPFVGAIVGPFDSQLPASASAFNWFYVGIDWKQRRIPKKLVYDLNEDSELPLYDQQRLLRLPLEYQSSEDRVNFRETWRQDSDETKMEKLIKSLGARMPWVQRQLQQQQQQQDDAVVSLSESVNDITMANTQVDSNINGDTVMEEQGPVNDESDAHDSGPDEQVVDTFLQKVQSTLINW